MIILRVLGLLLGIVLGLFILLTGFTLWAPMRVELRRKPPDGPIKLRGSFGPVKKVFTIGKRKKLPKQKAKQPQKEQKPKKEKIKSKTEENPARRGGGGRRIQW